VNVVRGGTVVKKEIEVRGKVHDEVDRPLTVGEKTTCDGNEGVKYTHRSRVVKP
jgi:hypothetical protein